MKICKKLISLVITFAILMSMSCSVAFADNSATEEMLATNVLLESGFTLEEIQNFVPENELASYAEVGPAISSTEVFLKISVDDETGTVTVTEMTEKACLEGAAIVQNLRENMSINGNTSKPTSLDSDIGGHDDINTSNGFMRMIVSAYPYLPYPDGDGDRRLKIAGQFIWLTTPNERFVNVVAVGHSSNLTQIGDSNDYTFEYSADIISTINGSKVDTYTANKSDVITRNADGGGTAVSFRLLADGYIGDTVSSNHRIYLTYDVETSATTDSTASVFADYYYQSLGVSLSPSLSFPNVGASLSITPSFCYTRLSPNAYIGFDV